MNEIFKKSFLSLFKIIVACALVYFTLGLFWAKTEGQYIFGFCLLLFVTLPTIFVVFFKVKMRRFLKIIYVLVLILFVFIIGTGLYRAYDRQKTQRAIDFINSKKITLDDVMGKNLPPQPDEKANNATIAGIDANKNYIRDDVELAIFKNYPNSAKIRAAELQYAQALQLELTQVFNSKTLVAVLQKESAGGLCLSKSTEKISLKDDHEKIVAVLAQIDNMQKNLEEIILNTVLRRNRKSGITKKYMIGYESSFENNCDVDASSLEN